MIDNLKRIKREKTDMILELKKIKEENMFIGN